jgi:hypothetical protein
VIGVHGERRAGFSFQNGVEIPTSEFPSSINLPSPPTSFASLLFASWLRSSVVSVLSSLTTRTLDIIQVLLSFFFLQMALVTSGLLCD